MVEGEVGVRDEEVKTIHSKNEWAMTLESE